MLCKKIINCKKWLAQIKKITDLPCFFANFVTCKDMVMKSPFFFLSGKSERFDLSFFCCPHKETGLHIVQKIYKMTTILNQKQIPWPFFTENLVKMKILNTFNFSFLSLRNRRYKVFRFLYIGQGLCPVYLLGMQIIHAYLTISFMVHWTESWTRWIGSLEGGEQNVFICVCIQ